MSHPFKPCSPVDPSEEKNKRLAAAGDKIVQALMLPVIAAMIEDRKGSYIQTDSVDVNIPCVAIKIRGYRDVIAIPNVTVADLDEVLASYEGVELFSAFDDAIVHPVQFTGLGFTAKK